MAQERVKGRNDVCRGKDCGKPIIWLRTFRGGWIPVNPEKVLELDSYFDHQRHTAHHATCPNAEDFRKKRQPR